MDAERLAAPNDAMLNLVVVPDHDGNCGAMKRIGPEGARSKAARNSGAGFSLGLASAIMSLPRGNTAILCAGSVESQDECGDSPNLASSK